MLSEWQLQQLLAVFDARVQPVVEKYLRAMGEHIRDIGQLKPSDINRLVELKRLNANVEQIKRAVAKAAEQSVGDIDTVFRATAESDERFMAAMFAQPHTPPIKRSELSTHLERLIKARLRVTAQSMLNLSNTTIESTGYRAAVDRAVDIVQSGLTDYRSAIRHTIKATASEGLRVVYPSGYIRRLDTAVRQNVLDGVRELNHDVAEQVGKTYGADGVEITAHALCAEDHLPYQGRQYSMDDFRQLQAMLPRQIGQWNCKHVAIPIILGVSPPTYTPEQLEQYRANSTAAIEIDGRTLTRYEWTQEQRQVETAVRAAKDTAILAAAAEDETLRRGAQAHINRLQAYYEHISDKAGLIERRERMTVSGFHRVKTFAELKR